MKPAPRWTAALLALLSASACGAPPTSKPAATHAPLQTGPLTSIAQGPGARWVMKVRPRELLTGPLGKIVGQVIDKPALDRFAKGTGVDLRNVEEGLSVGFGGATFYAASVPLRDLAAPVDLFVGRALPPLKTSDSRPDLRFASGSLASGGKASVATMRGPEGEVIVGDAGRSGPVLASVALAEKKLDASRSLAAQSPYRELWPFVADAPLAWLARCPLDEVMGEAKPSGEAVVLQECDGAAIAMRPAPGDMVAVSLRIAGRWGKDAPLVASDVRDRLAAASASNVGRILGLRDAATPTITADETHVDATMNVPAGPLAAGLARLAQPFRDDK